MAEGTCSVDGCERQADVRGWCNTHYVAGKRNGTIRVLPKPTPEDRFLRFVGEDSDGCWVWQGSKDRNGYGHFGVGAGVSQLAHRWSYEHFVGPIPAGLTLDHLCRKPSCVRPDHLEPCTQGENTKRGDGPTATNARKTHCVNGHEFTPENTYVKRDGGRNCRTCLAARNKARDRRRQRLDRAGSYVVANYAAGGD